MDSRQAVERAVQEILKKKSADPSVADRKEIIEGLIDVMTEQVSYLLNSPSVRFRVYSLGDAGCSTIRVGFGR